MNYEIFNTYKSNEVNPENVYLSNTLAIKKELFTMTNNLSYASIAVLSGCINCFKSEK